MNVVPGEMQACKIPLQLIKLSSIGECKGNVTLFISRFRYSSSCECGRSRSGAFLPQTLSRCRTWHHRSLRHRKKTLIYTSHLCVLHVKNMFVVFRTFAESD